MEAKEHVKCLIIGSGPAGYTAAIYAARADMKPVLYQGMQPGGQLTETTDVDNFPGYPQGINGTAMMVDLENQAKRFETDVRTGWVTAVDFSGDKKLVEIEEGKHVVSADSVIISPKIAGYVERVLVTENQTVASGDALVQLDVRDYRAQTNQVEAQIAELCGRP